MGYKARTFEALRGLVLFPMLALVVGFLVRYLVQRQKQPS